MQKYCTCDNFFYHYYRTHYEMHNNINTHVHVRKKIYVFCRFHYPLPPMCETKILEPFQINENKPFSQQYLQTQANKIFQYLKALFLSDDISFFEYLNS